jgi:hypothetical protein
MTLARPSSGYTHAQAWLVSLPKWAVPTAATAEQLLSALEIQQGHDPDDLDA